MQRNNRKQHSQQHSQQRNQQHSQHRDPPEGKRDDVYKEKTRQDIIDENIYLRWKNQGLSEFNKTLTDSKEAICKRFEEYQSYITDVYLSPEISTLTEKIKNLEDENDNLKIKLSNVSDVDEYKTKVVKLTEQINGLRNQLNASFDKIEDVNRQNSNYKERCDCLQKEVDSYRDCLSDIDKPSSKKSPSRKIYDLENKNKNLTKCLETYKSTCEKLKQEKINCILITTFVFLLIFIIIAIIKLI